MTGVFAELRVAARGMIKSPGLALLAVITSALGIGMNTLMFGIVNGSLYRGLPFPESDRIADISRTNPSEGMNRMSFTLHDFVDWRGQQSTVEALATGRTGTINMGGLERPARFDGEFVTANAFESLGGSSRSWGEASSRERRDPMHPTWPSWPTTSGKTTSTGARTSWAHRYGSTGSLPASSVSCPMVSSSPRTRRSGSPSETMSWKWRGAAGTS